MAIENTKVIIEAQIKEIVNFFDEMYGETKFTQQLIRSILESIKDQNGFEKIISLNKIKKMIFEEDLEIFTSDELTLVP